MPRAALALAIGLGLPASGFAADFAVPTAPVAATVFLSGASLERAGSADLPAGAHRLLLPLPAAPGTAPDLAAGIAVEGARLTGLRAVTALPAARSDLLTPAQSDALEALRAARAAVAEQEDALARLRAEVDGQEARIEVLRGVAPGAEPAGMAAAAAAVADGVAEASAAIVAAQAGIRGAETALEDARTVAARAEAALAAAGAPGDGAPGLIADVVLDAPGAVEVALVQQVRDAGWTPVYDLRLDSGAGTLRVERRAELRQATGEAWPGIALTLSTAEPEGRLAPAEPFPDIARIVDPDEAPPAPPLPLQERSADAAMLRSAPMDMPEAQPVQDGFALSYAVPGAVTVPDDEGGAATVLALGDVEIAPEIALRAVPEFERTAFVVARAENPGETLVPGEARHWRDGALVGRGWLPGWAEGAEAELPFGPVETVRLDHVVLTQDEGRAGVIRGGTERTVRVRFSVENTGGEAREVTALYALPVSEQSALRIAVDAAPPPDRRDVDDVRGIAAWDMMLAPGERREVELTFSFDWPEDRVLLWAP